MVYIIFLNTHIRLISNSDWLKQLKEPFVFIKIQPYLNSFFFQNQLKSKTGVELLIIYKHKGVTNYSSILKRVKKLN